MKRFLMAILFLCILINSGCIFFNENNEPIQYGSIQINSTPSGATIYIDNTDTGKVTPSLFPDITSSNHDITLSYFHYQNWKQTINIPANNTVTIDANLVYAPVQNITLQLDSTRCKDSNIWSALPDQIFSNAFTFIIGHENINDNILRGVIQFDFSQLPVNAMVTDTQLGLYYYSSIDPLATSIGMYQITNDWQETMINWNNQPKTAVTPEDTKIIPTLPTFDFIYWDISDLVTQWLNSTASLDNFGLLIKDINEATITTRKYFYSSDHATANQRPKLKVEYYLP